MGCQQLGPWMYTWLGCPVLLLGLSVFIAVSPEPTPHVDMLKGGWTEEVKMILL